jgi:hypothetical protein
MVETYLSRKHRNSLQRKQGGGSAYQDGDSSCSGSPRSAAAVSDRNITQEDDQVFGLAKDVEMGAPGEEIEMEEIP